MVESIPVVAKGLTRKTKENTISKLTDFCKDLQKKQTIENEVGPEAFPEPVEQVCICMYLMSEVVPCREAVLISETLNNYNYNGASE